MTEYRSGLVSVIMPTYNAQSFISTAIESVLIQTHKNFELLVWDDGSTDWTLEIAQSYAERHKQIKVFTSEHVGHVFASKKAISFASGEYLGLVDSDDYLDPTCLEKSVALIKNYPNASYVYTQYIDIDQDEKVIGLGKRCLIPYNKNLLTSIFNTFHFQLVRRTFYDQVGGFNEKYLLAVDYELCLRLSEVGEVYQVEEPLYYYRNHPNSLSKTHKQEQLAFAIQARNEALARRGYGI